MMTQHTKPKAANPFRYFNSSPEVIRAAVMLYVRFPLSLRNVEDLLFERGIDVCHETVRLWWNRFGPLFAADIRRRRLRHSTNPARTKKYEPVFSFDSRRSLTMAPMTDYLASIP
jgi:hypothetical protein